MGHIELSRDADLVVVAPATADLLARMAQRPRRRSRLDDAAGDRQARARRPGDECAHVAASGDAAQCRDAARRRRCCSSARTTARWRAANIGPGRHGRAAGDRRGDRARARKSRPQFRCRPASATRPQAARSPGRHVVVTSGPTYEPIDPVRFIGNRSSGLQGHAIAQAARGGRREGDAGQRPGRARRSRRRRRRSMSRRAREMQAAARRRCRPTSSSPPRRSPTGASRPRRAEDQEGRRRRAESSRWSKIPTFSPSVGAQAQDRPALVVGFAAETENVIENARDKLARKGCDLIVANSVAEGTGTFGGSDNAGHRS